MGLNLVHEHGPNTCECFSSPFIEFSQRPNKHLQEFGLQYSDTYIYSPRESKVTKKKIDRDWFRKFRVGLNVFNLFPTKGICYLIEEGFLADSPAIIAYFLANCTGLSKYQIGCYIGNSENQLSIDILRHMMNQLEIEDMELDQALEHCFTCFHLLENRQKTHLILRMFCQRFVESNPDFSTNFKNPIKAVKSICCALLVLNTHIRERTKPITMREFTNLIIDTCRDEFIDLDMIKDMYRRVKARPFSQGWDFVTEICDFHIYNRLNMHAELEEYHRRLVFDCVMYRKKYGLHSKMILQIKLNRVHVLVFNDLIAVIKKRSKGTYRLVGLLNFADVTVETRFEQECYRIRFRCKSSNEICLRLVTQVEQKAKEFLWVIREVTCEVQETDSVLANSLSTEID